MSLFYIKDTLEDYLRANWSATEIAFFNVPYSNNPIDYIECFILGENEEKTTINHAAPYTQFAIFQINVKRKSNYGTGTLTKNIDLLKQLFRYKDINGVICKNVSVGPTFQDNDYMVMPLSINCEYRN